MEEDAARREGRHDTCPDEQQHGLARARVEDIPSPKEILLSRARPVADTHEGPPVDEVQQAPNDESPARDDAQQVNQGGANLTTVPIEQAYWEKGMFANQNSACKLRQEFTLQRLAQHFDLGETE